MSSSVQLLENKIVPIRLQLEISESGMFPTAVIFDDEGAVLDIRTLSHAQGGIYFPDLDYIMPNLSFINIQYIVYEDAARTIISNEFGVDEDLFVLKLSTQDILDRLDQALDELRRVGVEMIIEETQEVDLFLSDNGDQVELEIENGVEIEMEANDNDDVVFDVEQDNEVVLDASS